VGHSLLEIETEGSGPAVDAPKKHESPKKEAPKHESKPAETVEVLHGPGK
jgi:hypothetical protein